MKKEKQKEKYKAAVYRREEEKMSRLSEHLPGRNVADEQHTNQNNAAEQNMHSVDQEPQTTFSTLDEADDEADAEAELRREQERRKKIHDFLRTEYARLSAYVILTFLAIYLIIRIGNHAPQILSAGGKVLSTLGSLLTPLLWGFVIAYLLYPLMKRLMRLYARLPRYQRKGRDPRGLAVASIMIVAVGVIILLLSVAFSAVTHQLKMVSLDDLGGFITSLSISLNEMYKALEQRLTELNISSEELNNAVESLSSWFGSLTAELGSYLTSSLTDVTGFFSDLVFAIIFAIYFMIDAKGLETYWDKNLKAVSSRRVYQGVHQLLDDADCVFSGYIRGQVIDALIMAVMVSISLTFVGVRFSVIIGILTGLGNLIPYVGPVIAYVSTVLVCLLNGDLQKLVISVIVLFVIQTIDGNVINPKLLSNSIHVHPMLVIVALVIGGAVGGVLGMLIAVPVAALIKLWFDRGIEALIRHKQDRAQHMAEEEIQE